MAVRVLVLNCLAQTFSRQRNGMVLCFAPVGTLSEPRCGPATP